MRDSDCQFKVYRISEKFSGVNYCDNDDCKKCQSIKEELEIYKHDKMSRFKEIHPIIRTFIIGISPTPDYLSYWKSSEGLNQIIDGLFREKVRELNKVKVLLSFDFKPIKGFSIPLFCFVCEVYGDLESINLIEDELNKWSPRICGWLNDVSESEYNKTVSELNSWEFKDFLTPSELEYLSDLIQLSPIELDWTEFMNLREIGILNRMS